MTLPCLHRPTTHPDKAMNHTTQEPKAMYLAVELEYRREYEAAHELRAQQARIAELEAQLYAIGAGGVGASIQPQAQPDTAPAAWAIFTRAGFCRMWSQDRALVERTAAELGVKAEPLYRCTGRAQ